MLQVGMAPRVRAGKRGGMPAILLLLLTLSLTAIDANAYVGVEEPPGLEPLWEREIRNRGYILPLPGGRQAVLIGPIDVLLLDMETGSVVSKLYTTRHSGNVISEPMGDPSTDASGTLLAIPAGGRLVVVNIPNASVVWDSGVSVLKHTVVRAWMSFDGSLVMATTLGGPSGLIRVGEGLLWKIEGGMSDAAFDMERRVVAIAQGNSLALLTIEEGTELWRKGFKEVILEVDFSPSGTYIAVGDEAGNVRIVDSFEGRVMYEKNLGQPVADLVYAGEDRLVVLLVNGTIIHMTPLEGKILDRLSPLPGFGGNLEMRLTPDLRGFVYTNGIRVAYYYPPVYARLTINGYPGAKVMVKGPGGEGSWTIGEEGLLRLYLTRGEYEVSYKLASLPYPLIPITASPPVERKTISLTPGEEAELSFPTPTHYYALLTVRNLIYGDSFHDVILSAPDGERYPLITLYSGEGDLNIFLVPGEYTLTEYMGWEERVIKQFYANPGDHIVLDLPRPGEGNGEEPTRPSTTQAPPSGETMRPKAETQPRETGTVKRGEGGEQTSGQAGETPSRPAGTDETRVASTQAATSPASWENQSSDYTGDGEGGVSIRLDIRLDLNTLLLALIALLLVVNLIFLSRKRRG